MKKVSIILFLFFLFPFPVTAEEDPAEEDYSRYPGYVDLSALEGFKKSGKSVDVWCLNYAIAHGAQPVEPHLVTHDHQDVGLLRFRLPGASVGQ